MAKRHTDDMTAKLEKFESSTREGRGGRFTGTSQNDDRVAGNTLGGFRHIPMDAIESNSDLSAKIDRTSGFTRKGPSK